MSALCVLTEFAERRVCPEDWGLDRAREIPQPGG